MNKTKNPELYLYYSLKIEPFDLVAVNIKKNLDLSQIALTKKTLKNEEIKEYFKKKGEFCPISSEYFIETNYVEYEENNHLVKILFYKINNSELLTPNIILNSDSKNILTSIHRTINLENNLLQEYDKYFNSELDNIITNLSSARYYNLTKIYINDFEEKIFGNTLKEYPIDEILNYKLFDYQIDNINWMLELESNPVYDYISSDKLYFFPDGRIYNYTQNLFQTNKQRELTRFRGGIILDTVGIGKTLQLLCLAISNTNLKTMILVPDHLVFNWNNEFKKHFKINLPEFISIINFSNFNETNYNMNNYDRLIIDEIHELYSNRNYKNIFKKCLKTDCKFKWGITATPFPVPNSIFNLIKFLTEQDLYYPNLDRFKYFYPTYYKIFRKNTLENIVQEIKLPSCFEHNLILEFNDQERILYDAETQSNNNSDEYFLRKCCCDAMLNFKNKNKILTLSDFNNLVLSEYKNKYIEEANILNKYIEYYDNCLKFLEIIDNYDHPDSELLLDNTKEINEIILKTNKKDLFDNIQHYEYKITEQKTIVANRKQSYDYLNNKINEINKECPVCLNNIEDNNKYSVPECGHICCLECMEYWLSSNSSCTICRKTINKNTLYTITNIDDIKLKYSTKVDKLLEIIKNSKDNFEKFIIYTQFDNLIDKLNYTLITEGIQSTKLVNLDIIEEFKNNNEKRVLILSSVKNASGIDLSFVSNIIIFEPIIGDNLFLKDVEKQIIGRIYRINQTKNINIFRFIIKDTIEEKIFTQTLHNYNY